MVLCDLLTSLFAGVVLVCAVRATNHMNKHTCHRIRLAVLVLAVASLGIVLAPLYPNSMEARYAGHVFVIAVALFMAADGRRRRDRDEHLD